MRKRSKSFIRCPISSYDLSIPTYVTRANKVNQQDRGRELPFSRKGRESSDLAVLYALTRFIPFPSTLACASIRYFFIFISDSSKSGDMLCFPSLCRWSKYLSVELPSRLSLRSELAFHFTFFVLYSCKMTKLDFPSERPVSIDKIPSHIAVK